MAEEKIKGNVLANAIIAKAREALQFRSLETSVEVQRVIGQIRGHLR